AVYDAVVARYSSSATAALGRLLLPYLFPELSAFATVEDLVSHLRASYAHYRAAVHAEFFDRNPPPMYITLYFIVTGLLDSLCSVGDHFLFLDPTSLTVDLLEQHLLAAETSAVAVDVIVPEDVGAASASAKRRSSKGKGGRGGGGGSGGGGGGSGSGGGGSSGGGGGDGTVGGSGGSGGGGGGSDGSGGSGGGGTGCGGTGARRVGSGGGQRQQQQHPSETSSPQQLRDQHHCFSRLDDAWRAEFGDDVELPRLADLLKSRIAIFDLDFDAILSSVTARLLLLSLHLSRTAALQDAMVTATTPGGQRVLICTCTQTGRHLATFTRRPGSSLYILATEPSQTLHWHHRLGHPSLPCLRGMHSRLLVSSLPRSLPPIPPSPAPPCHPCVKGRQQAAPHSSSFPPTTAPLQTLHMDVWDPARVSGQSHEHYFLLVVDDYTRYTMVFPLQSKGQVVDVLIPWIRTVRLQLRERFCQDLPVLRLHSDKGGEFSSDLLRDLCRGEGILQSFSLLDSPQQNGIGERRIGLVMEVA
ncbi:unnamed protein product, partial [Closterium sp. NIES-53]